MQAGAQFALFREVRFFFDFGLHFGSLLESLWPQIGTKAGPKSVFRGLRLGLKKTLKKGDLQDPESPESSG